MKMKLGRQARAFNPKIKHMRAVYGKPLPTPPVSIDWSHNITDFGVMLNDRLGDCTCAAVYHARQIWTVNTLTEQTESDNCVLKLYEEATGYNPANPATDQGGVEQYVLSYLLNTGIPLNDGTRDKILGFIEVDHTNINDVKLTIAEFGVAYIGFNVPNSLFAAGEPPTLWTVSTNPYLASTEGGHAIVLVAYDNEGPTCISWGKKYKMTWEFFLKYTDEVYAIIDKSWIATTGKTPLNLDVAALEELMSDLRS
jgi:hypothetical protein